MCAHIHEAVYGVDVRRWRGRRAFISRVVVLYARKTWMVGNQLGHNLASLHRLARDPEVFAQRFHFPEHSAALSSGRNLLRPDVPRRRWRLRRRRGDRWRCSRRRRSGISTSDEVLLLMLLRMPSVAAAAAVSPRIVVVSVAGVASSVVPVVI